MRIACCHDRERLEEFLRRDPLLYIYLLGDLDDFFWPHTTWYVLEEAGRIVGAALLYTGMELPVLHAVERDPESGPETGTESDRGGPPDHAGARSGREPRSSDRLRELVSGIAPLLPRRFYAHLTGDLAGILRPHYRVIPHGEHYRMGLTDPLRLAPADRPDAFRLMPEDEPELRVFYAESYPGNWFDPRMLETGFYFGLRRSGKLVSVAGIHVYSPRYRAAALGNVTTHPQWRGQGLAKGVCARLCLELLGSTEFIGLNVKADNEGAIACYRALGFSRVMAYGEYAVGPD
jgi:ribosomal protein S18 acetylase RimI-like enzyme